MLTLVLGHILDAESLEHLYMLVGQRTTVLIGGTYGRKLLGHPANAYPQNDTPTRKHIEGRDHLGIEYRIAEGQHKHTHP